MYDTKQLDFESFKQAAKIMSFKGHLTVEGVQGLSAIKSSMLKLKNIKSFNLNLCASLRKLAHTL
jgi:hypothetical protein